MKYLADENFTNTALKTLQREGIDIIRISRELRSSADLTLLSVALQDQRVLVTFDKDFGELLFRRSAGSLGVVLFNLTPLTRNAVVARVCDVLRSGHDFRQVFASSRWVEFASVICRMS